MKKNTLYENLELLKNELFDSPDEIKGAFNTVVKYFTPKSQGIDDYILWKSISIKDKETGMAITIYGDDGAMILKSKPNEDQKKLLRSLGMSIHEEKIQIGPSQFKDYILVDMQIPRWGSQLQSTAKSLSNKYEIHGVPDEQFLKMLKEKDHIDTSRIKYFSGKTMSNIKHHYAVSHPTSNGDIKWEIMEISGDTPPYTGKQGYGFKSVKLD